MRELWRLLVLSASVLVVSVAFAAAVRPLASGELEPASALKFMALAMPPMMQFALPFAAGFAATICYHRFASENEATAASAGGVSYSALLAPAAFTGLILATLLAGMTNLAIPWFFGRMERLVSRDAAQILVNSIERGETVNLEGMLIHADRVHRVEPDEEQGAFERLILEGVIAINPGEDGLVESDMTTERADVWLYADQLDGDDVTVVLMRVSGFVSWARDGSPQFRDGEFEMEPIVFPHGFRDKPKYMTAWQLLQLKERPEKDGAVRRRTQELAQLLAKTRALDVIRNRLREDALVFQRDEGDTLSVHAGGLTHETRGWRLTPESGADSIELDWRLANGELRLQQAQAAWLSIDVDLQRAGVLVTLELEQVATPETEIARRVAARHGALMLPGDPTDDIFGLGARGLVALAQRRVEDWAGEAGADEQESLAAGAAQRNEIAAAGAELTDRVERLERQIVATWHERFALPAASFVMTITGAVMAMRLRAAMPLTVFLWSFFPALASVISISSGQNVAEDNLPLGLALIWSAVGALALYAGIVFLSLRRH